MFRYLFIALILLTICSCQKSSDPLAGIPVPVKEKAVEERIVGAWKTKSYSQSVISSSGAVIQEPKSLTVGKFDQFVFNADLSFSMTTSSVFTGKYIIEFQPKGTYTHALILNPTGKFTKYFIQKVDDSELVLVHESLNVSTDAITVTVSTYSK